MQASVMSGRRVELLVVLYAINVFLTFTLSQLGMSVQQESMMRGDFAVQRFRPLWTAAYNDAEVIECFRLMQRAEGGDSFGKSPLSQKEASVFQGDRTHR